MQLCVMSLVLIDALVPLGTGPLAVTILYKTKDIAGMSKDANLEGCYYNSALPTLFVTLRTGGDLSYYTIVKDGELYIDEW